MQPNISQSIKLLKTYFLRYARANQASQQEIQDSGDALDRTLALYQKVSKDKAK